VDLGVRGRSFLVLGGTRGMGLAAARALAADGASVALAGRDRATAEAVASELRAVTGAEVLPLTGDLTVAGTAEEMVAAACGELGALSGMAVTTGLGGRAQHGLADATDEDWTASFEDILLATVRACRAVIPRLVDAGGGAIVTTAAHSIRSPKARQVPYAALKAAVANVTKNIAKAYGPDGVRANCVCPGATETDILAAMRLHYAQARDWPVEQALERALAEEWGMKVALGRAGRPEELGDVIAFLLSERAGYVTGALVNVDGGTDF
jgi:NAD(P)-dependent dehydrogenase (short-subunit alcohol dehydrogenase family)